MIKAIIFDFFGVIYSEPYNVWLRNHGFVREGSFLEAVQKTDSGQISMSRFFDLLSTLSGQSSDKIITEFDMIERIDIGTVGLISALKKNYKIGLLSNASSSFIRHLLLENDLEKYFDEIIVSSEVGLIKPSSEIYEVALDRLGFNPSEVLFIDDNKSYTEGAEKIGIKSIIFKSVDQVEQELRKLKIIL